jgi:hypothetical protein
MPAPEPCVSDSRVFDAKDPGTVRSKAMRAWKSRTHGERTTLREFGAKTRLGVAALSRAVPA